MKWVLIGERHINTDQVQVFLWAEGKLTIFYAGDEEGTIYLDADKKKYYKLCRAVGVRPAEEGPPQ